MMLDTSPSIRLKVIIIVLASAFVGLLIAGSALLIYDLRNYESTWRGDLTAQADILARANAPALAFDDPVSAQEYLRLLRVRPVIVAAAIYNVNGRLFASYTRKAEENYKFPVLPGQAGVQVEGNSFILFKRVEENNEILGTVYLHADYDVWGRIQDYALILAIVMAVSLLGALLFSFWLQALITRPILAVTDIARKVMEQRDFSLRVRKTTADEVGILVDAFNDMLAEVGRRDDALRASNQSLEREVSVRKRAEDDMLELNANLERRVSERTSQLESANKELEGFSYSVSHDLRAPVRAIIGFSKILEKDHTHDLDEEGRRLLGIVHNEANRMGQLIDDLLAFSRLGRKEMQLAPVDMKELVTRTYDNLLTQHEGPTVKFQLGTLPTASGDRSLLAQVWVNLLANALKFSSKREQPVIEVNAISEQNEYVYFVRDNGAGFDPRHQAKLFGVFQRLHTASEFPGTGVGLALVQRIVNRHGGRIWAESKLGEGATFYFSLPKERSHGNG